MIALLTHNLAPRSEKKEKQKNKEKEKKKRYTRIRTLYSHVPIYSSRLGIVSKYSTYLGAQVLPYLSYRLCTLLPFHSITSYNIKQGNIKSSPKHRLHACKKKKKPRQNPHLPYTTCSPLSHQISSLSNTQVSYKHRFSNSHPSYQATASPSSSTCTAPQIHLSKVNIAN